MEKDRSSLSRHDVYFYTKMERFSSVGGIRGTRVGRNYVSSRDRFSNAWPSRLSAGYDACRAASWSMCSKSSIEVGVGVIMSFFLFSNRDSTWTGALGFVFSSILVACVVLLIQNPSWPISARKYCGFYFCDDGNVIRNRSRLSMISFILKTIRSFF